MIEEIMQWIREQLWKSCRSKQSARDYPGFAQVQSVGLFFSDQEDSRKLAEVLRSRLKQEDKEVHLLGHLSEKRKDLSATPSFPSYARDECSFLGEPRSPEAREFLAQPTEVLIDAHPGDHPSIGFVRHCANTKFCLSTSPNYEKGEGVEVYFPLTQVDYPHEAAEEIVKYLKFINKK